MRPREYFGPEGSVISENISTESQMKSHEGLQSRWAVGVVENKGLKRIRKEIH